MEEIGLESISKQTWSEISFHQIAKITVKSIWNLSEISEESRGLETEIVSGLMMEEITSKGGGSKNTSYKGGADTVTTKDSESRTRPDGQTPKTNVGRRQFGPAPAMNQL